MDKREESIAVSKLYYESNLTQQQIADKLEMSRPTVSRLLQYAKEAGFVEIRIIDPADSVAEIEKRLKKKYNLQHVIVANAPLEALDEQKKALGAVGGRYIAQIVRPGDIIGVGWGSSLYQMAQRLTTKLVQDVSIVQLKGGISLNSNKTYAYEILHLFSHAFSAQSYSLPLPVMFGMREVKELVETDDGVRLVLDLGKRANIAVFTVGAANLDSLIFRLGYRFSPQERKNIDMHAVGDILSRFYDENGDIVDPAVDARTVGLGIEDLKQKEKRILIAGGKHKVRSIHPILRYGIANIFITDNFTAKQLLDDDRFMP